MDESHVNTQDSHITIYTDKVDINSTDEDGEAFGTENHV